MPQLNHEARRKLKELVLREGPRLGENESRCRGLLGDHCPHLEIEVNLLCDAIRGNVPRRLLDVTGSLTIEIDKLTKTLRDKRGIAEENARWAVESWAFALGLIDGNYAATRTAAPTMKAPPSIPPQPAAPISRPAPPTFVAPDMARPFTQTSSHPPPFAQRQPAAIPGNAAAQPPVPPWRQENEARSGIRSGVLVKTVFALLCVGCLVAGAILFYLAKQSGSTPDRVATPAGSTPTVSTPAISTPVVSTPALSTPAVSTPAISAPVVSTPVVSTPATPTPIAPTPAHSTASTDPDTFTSPTLGTKFVRIKPGTFMMGSPAGEQGHRTDETQHRVTLTKPFYMAIYHVTRGDFRKFIEDDHYTTDAEKANSANTWKHNTHFAQSDIHPVVEVSWNDAIAFINWLSHKENRGNGHRYRLPTEAEWEYACRAVDNPGGPWTPFNTGATISTDLANYDGRSTYGAGVEGINRQRTTPSGSLPANKFGLCDMHGNAWQWCSDVYGAYPAGAVTDPTGPEQKPGSARVLRGGSWGNDAGICRSACRNYIVAEFQSDDIGFRIVLDSP